MPGTVFAKLAALVLGVFGLVGCHLCRDDCPVTKVCCPEVKTEKVIKEGWDVECVQICIPPIHGPCSDSCEWKCGKVIGVKRLKADELELGEKCVVEYKLVEACRGVSGCPCPACNPEPDKAEAPKKEPKKESPVEAPSPDAEKAEPKADPIPKPPVELEAAAPAQNPDTAWASRRAPFSYTHLNPGPNP